MTKVFAFTRESPGTNNNGDSQEQRIVLAYKYLSNAGVVPKTDCPIPRFDAQGVSRDCVLSSPVFYKLMKEIKLVSRAECIFVFVTSILRIGVEFNKIMLFYFMLRHSHPKLQMIFLDEYGLDIPSCANALSKYHASLHGMKVKHVNPAASLQVSDKDVDLHNSVKVSAKLLKHSWNNDDRMLNAIRNSLQENSSECDVLIESLIQRIRQAIRDGTNVEEDIRHFRETLWQKTFLGERQVAFYCRTSQFSKSKVVNGVVLDQMAFCFSHYQQLPTYHPTADVLTYQDIKKKRYAINPGLKCLLASVLDGRVSEVFVKNTNRITSTLTTFSAILEICRQCDVTLHFSQMIGVDIMSAVRKDTERMVERMRHLTTYNETISELKANMNADDLHIHKNLSEIQCFVNSKSKMRTDDSPIDEEDENWSDWTSLPKLSNEEDD
jgi:hypothetical protein